MLCHPQDTSHIEVISFRTKSAHKRRSRCTPAKKLRQTRATSAKHNKLKPHVIREAAAKYQEIHPHVHRVAAAKYKKNHPHVKRVAAAKYKKLNPRVQKVAAAKYKKTHAFRG